MSGSVRTLSAPQLLCMELELMGTPVAAIAKRLKSNDRTIRRWRALPEYVTEITLRREDRGRGFRDALEALVYPALQSLSEIASSPEAEPHLRIAAAGKLLDHGAKIHTRREDRELIAAAKAAAEEEARAAATAVKPRRFRWVLAGEETADDAKPAEPPTPKRRPRRKRTDD